MAKEQEVIIAQDVNLDIYIKIRKYKMNFKAVLEGLLFAVGMMDLQ